MLALPHYLTISSRLSIAWFCQFFVLGTFYFLFCFCLFFILFYFILFFIFSPFITPFTFLIYPAGPSTAK